MTTAVASQANAPTATTLAATFRAKALREALAKVAPAIPSRSPKVVLQNVLLIVHPDGSADVQATNLEQSVRFSLAVEDPITCEAGECLLPPPIIKLIGQFAQYDPTAAVRIETDGESVRVESGKHKSTVPADDPSLFPQMPTFDGVPEFVHVDGAEFKQAIKQTVPATDVESTRYALGGCLMAVDAGRLTMVATDGRILVQRKLTGDLADEADRSAGVVPVPALKLVAASIDDDFMLAIRADARSVVFSGPGWAVMTRLVEGRFPRYQDVFPTEPPMVAARIDRDALAAAIGRVAATAVTAESGGIDFAFADGVLELSATAADRGSASDSVDYEFDGPGGQSVGVTLGHEFLSKILGSAPETAEWKVVDHKNAVMLCNEPSGYTAVIMPLTRDR